MHIPALDLTGEGGSREEAKASLKAMMKTYFEQGMLRGRLYENLVELGWQIGPAGIFPPDFYIRGIREILRCIKSGTSLYDMSCRIELPEEWRLYLQKEAD